jgi:hypothetical protein
MVGDRHRFTGAFHLTEVVGEPIAKLTDADGGHE